MRHFLALTVGLLFACSLSSASAAPSTPKPASERWSDSTKLDDASFRRHVIPLFSRAGCSGRECHGAFSGQGGFQLSLFGYDFEKDHKEITQDSDGGEAEVRVNPEKPEESLILTKATATTKHKGKERFAKGSWEYNLVLNWIKGGAKLDVEQTGEFDRLEVQPEEIIFKQTGDTVQLRVLAHWKDGTVEDITQLTRFRSNDDAVSTVSEIGKVTCAGPGDTHIVAFYDNGVHPIPVMLPVSDKVGAKYPKIAARTKVDDLILTKLRKVAIVPSGICTDTEFLRRVSLDVTGTLPTPEEVRAFTADNSADKRARKIDELLSRPAYAAWWSTMFCDWTGNNASQLRGGSVKEYNADFSRQWYEWVRVRMAKNEPYDELVAGMVMALGRTSPDQSYEDYAREMSSYLRKDHPADFSERKDMPYFWLRQNVRKPEEKALAFAHSFLGVRIECAQCHKHPFDQWTKTDFESFQAFFEPIRYATQNNAKEPVSYKTLTAKLHEAVGEVDKKSERKLMEKEFEKLVSAGEPAPWQELFVTRPQVPRKLNEKQLEQIKKKNPNFSGRVITPKILGGDEVMLTEYPDPRKPLMDWMRGQDNPYFARAFVNRLWAAYFGRGIVEPADDMNLANPPVNKELMDHLAKGFAAHGYDMKWAHREILNSDAYQRSWQPNDSNKLDEKNFSHMVLRRVPAEVALDAIAQATAASADLSRFSADIAKRAIGPSVEGYSRKGLSSYALATFGKPARLTNCDCERNAEPTLLQTLFTRNDPELLTRLETGKNSAWIDELRKAHGLANTDPKRAEGELKRIRASREELKARQQKLTASGDATELDLKKVEKGLLDLDQREQKLTATLAASKPEDLNTDSLIQETFLRTVSRTPTAEEIARARADIQAASDPINGVRDLLWAMLNTREFLVNH